MKTLAMLLLLLPIDVVSPKASANSWVTVTNIMLFVGRHADNAYSMTWSGAEESGPVLMPQKLQDWNCIRGGDDRGNRMVSYVQCKCGDATIVIDATCKSTETDADLGTAVLLNKVRDYGGRFLVTCTTSQTGS